MIKIVYIDDEKEERDEYKIKFKMSKLQNMFDLLAINTPKTQEDYKLIKSYDPELFLIDYDLSIADEDGDVFPYTGFTLVTDFRKRFPNIPSVIFTKINYIKKDIIIPEQMFSIVDDVIFKRELFELPGFKGEINFPALFNLSQLAIAYKEMKQKGVNSFEKLYELLKDPCGMSNFEDLVSANTQYLIESSKNSLFFNASNWIRKVLIKYPGVLYESLHAATYLGISEAEFLSTYFQKLFREAEYKGIFAPHERRWWRKKIHEISLNLFTEIEKSSLPLSKIFPELYEKENKTTLEKSVCLFSKESPADCICYIEKKPVKFQYSLAYYPDSRPSIMDQVRVSFKAIKENKIKIKFLDQSNIDLLKKIKKGRMYAKK